MSTKARLAKVIYPDECVAQAIDDYSDFCAVKVCEITPGDICVEFNPGVASPQEADRVVHEFLNYLLDLSVEKHLSGAQH